MIKNFKEGEFMAKKKRSDSENKDLCKSCTSCCDYVCTTIDKPTTIDDVDEIFWFLHHKNVHVFIDSEGDWNLYFITKCEPMKNNGDCGIYKVRPKVCREHNQDDCEGKDVEEYYEHLFKEPNDFLAYIKKRKGMTKIYQRLQNKIKSL
jgi:uncharacterized protein